MSDDPVMDEILAAITGFLRGDRVGGRAALETIWARIAHDRQPIHECTLAHYLADAQDDLASELAWDLRALSAARRCTDADAALHAGLPSIAVFLPSLHANLAEDYFKLRDLSRAREHLAAANTSAGHLKDDAYGRLVRGGIERLAQKLAASG
jgi:hypothetical protein